MSGETSGLRKMHMPTATTLDILHNLNIKCLRMVERKQADELGGLRPKDYMVVRSTCLPTASDIPDWR